MKQIVNMYLYEGYRSNEALDGAMLCLSEKERSMLIESSETEIC